MKFLKKAFTLVEMLIVILIVGILFVVLMQVYITASKLYVYQTNVKNIEKDVLFFNQNLQNLVDNTEIDYTKYVNLGDTLGFTGNLYLKDGNVSYKLYQSGTNIFLDKIVSGNKTSLNLTNSGVIDVKKLDFKIIPFEDPYKVFGPKAMQPFVTVFLDIRVSSYSTGHWQSNVKYNLQESFNFKYFKN